MKRNAGRISKQAVRLPVGFGSPESWLSPKRSRRCVRSQDQALSPLAYVLQQAPSRYPSDELHPVYRYLTLHRLIIVSRFSPLSSCLKGILGVSPCPAEFSANFSSAVANLSCSSGSSPKSSVLKTNAKSNAFNPSLRKSTKSKRVFNPSQMMS